MTVNRMTWMEDWKKAKTRPRVSSSTSSPTMVKPVARMVAVPLLGFGQNGREHRRLLGGQFARVNAVVVLRRRLDAVHPVAHLNHIYVELQDPLLRKEQLHPNSVVGPAPCAAMTAPATETDRERTAA